MLIKTSKTKLSVRISALLMCVMLLIPCIPVTGFAVYYDKADYDDIKNSTLEEMREQLAEYDKLMKDLEAQLGSNEELQEDALEAAKIYLTQKAIYEDQRKLLEATKLEYDVALEEAGKQLAQLQMEYDEAYERFLELLCMTYEEGSANYLEIILGAASLSDLLSRVERVSAMMKYSDTLLTSLTKKQAELDERYQVLTLRIEEQETLIADLAAKEAEIDKWNAENEAALLEIDATLAELIAKYDEYKSKADILDADFETQVNAAIKAENKRREEIAKKEAEEEERRRQEELAAQVAKEGYMWPVPTKWNYISSYFGIRDVPALGYYGQNHGAIDIPATRGTPIYATKSGKVIVSTYHSSYGNYVLLDHGNGYQTLYAHASKRLVKAGDYVTKGDIIAEVGTTGSSTGNHLHFEVRKNGVKVDPLEYVNKP